MTNTLAVEQDVKNFYSSLKFPGYYTKKQLLKYKPLENNLYLRFINKYLKQGHSVVDIGCGSGLVTNLLAEHHNCQFTALDFADSIEIGKSYSKNNNLHNIDWIKDNILSYDFNRQFDVVICQGVLHHIPAYHEALKKIKSLVKPNGILLLGVYNPFGKIIKKITKLSYNNDILYQDQEHNPYETSFFAGTVIDLCSPLNFLEAGPGGYNKYACNVISMFNSRNGGLTLYAFKNTSHV
jgi:2-polyprenyl-3-methyl-5-hydroxy-6-metoxy-1,4-benzoquinol methylase